jgi:hypothetical protein
MLGNRSGSKDALLDRSLRLQMHGPSLSPIPKLGLFIHEPVGFIPASFTPKPNTDLATRDQTAGIKRLAGWRVEDQIRIYSLSNGLNLLNIHRFTVNVQNVRIEVAEVVLQYAHV